MLLVGRFKKVSSIGILAWGIHVLPLFVSTDAFAMCAVSASGDTGGGNGSSKEECRETCRQIADEAINAGEATLGDIFCMWNGVDEASVFLGGSVVPKGDIKFKNARRNRINRNIKEIDKEINSLDEEDDAEKIEQLERKKARKEKAKQGTDYVGRLKNIDSRVSLAEGLSIDSEKAAELRKEIATVLIQQKYFARDKKLSGEEGAKLNIKLLALEAKVARASGAGGYAESGTLLNARIRQGQKKDRLDTKESKNLKAKLAQYSANLKLFSEDGLTDEEKAQLDVQLNDIKDQMTLSSHNDESIDERVEHMKDRLNEGALAKNIPANKKKKFLAELNQIKKDWKAQAKANENEKLTREQRIAIQRRIGAVGSELNETIQAKVVKKDDKKADNKKAESKKNKKKNK